MHRVLYDVETTFAICNVDGFQSSKLSCDVRPLSALAVPLDNSI